MFDENVDPTFAMLMQQARGGSDDAANHLVEQYGPYIMRAVRRRLQTTLRPKFDSQDFAQAVWTSFFKTSNEINNVDTPEQLIRLLVAMAKNKVIDEGRKRQTQKYSVDKEQYIDEIEPMRQQQLHSREPTPSQFAIAREEWDRLLKDQPTHYRDVVNLKLAGETHQAIAKKIGISEKTVQRVLKKLLQSRTE